MLMQACTICLAACIAGSFCGQCSSANSQPMPLCTPCMNYAWLVVRALGERCFASAGCLKLPKSGCGGTAGYGTRVQSGSFGGERDFGELVRAEVDQGRWKAG